MELKDFKRIRDAIVPDERGCRIWPLSLAGRGYPQLRLGRMNVYGHRLSLELKLGRNIATGMVARHSCDRPACVEEEHLHEGTQKQNIADSLDRGRFASGSRNGRAVLVELERSTLMRLHESGLSVGEISKELSVSRDVVRRVLRGKHWSQRV